MFLMFAWVIFKIFEFSRQNVSIFRLLKVIFYMFDLVIFSKYLNFPPKIDNIEVVDPEPEKENAEEM